MRVMTVSFGFMVLRSYQWKAVELARQADAFLAVVPASWRFGWARTPIPPEHGPLERVPHKKVKLLLNSFSPRINKHIALFPPNVLGNILRALRPDVVDFDNEVFNLASAQLTAAVRRHAPRARVYMHASQNLDKTYPPPFSWTEQYVLNRCTGVFARSAGAAAVLERRGFPPHKLHILGHGVSLMEFASPRSRQLAGRPIPGSVL